MRKPFLLSLLVALLTTLSIHAYDFQSGDLYYNITSDNTVEVTYQEQWSESNYQGLTTATIPATVTDNGTTYSVTSIGEWAFSGCSSLTSIILPNSVTSIGGSAFENCYSLTSLTLPNSVTSIGGSAFADCSALTSITLPNSVRSIGNYAFYDCSSLTSLTLPNSVTSIGGGAFRDCSSLTSIVVESGNTMYDSRENCNAIIETASNTLIVGCQSTTIPNSVTSIGEGAFEECYSLTSITIPNSVTSIGEAAFYYCSSLTSLTLPNSVTSIGYDAFGGCTSLPVEDNLRYADTYLVEAVDKSLSTYTIKARTKWIGSEAFSGCSSLTSITLPNSVTNIGGSAFADCSALTSITLPNSVTNIGGSAFADCSALTSITLPNSVTSIGYDAFGGCTSLPVEDNLRYADTYLVEAVDKSLSTYTIKARTKWIGSEAFSGCSSLTSITLPNSVTNIGGSAFADCSALTSVTIPNSVTSIGDNAFYDVPNIVYSGTAIGSPWGARSVNGYVEGYLVYADEKKTTLLACSAAAMGEITIPNSVTSIGDYAFYDCSSLTSLTLPNSVTSIGEGAFVYCSSLTSLTLPNSVTSIGEGAFVYCSSLTSITLPNSVTSIGGSAFGYCSSLTSLTLPNSVTSIGEGAFYGCSSLTSITIPNFVTSIGYYAFGDCTSLTSITLPNSVTSIGDYAFEGCTSLTSVVWNAKNCAGWSYYESAPFYEIRANITSFTFGEEVETIPSSLCYGMSSLTSVTIGNSVTSIGEGAFYECTSLADIYCYATTPPVCYVDTEYGTFVGVNKHCRIHVPAGTLEDYQWAPVWSDFYHFFEISELPDGAPTDQVGVTVTGNYATFSWPVNSTASSYTLTITKDGEVFCTLIFNNMGQLVGMAFAPARDGKPSAKQDDAQSTAYGFSFVVTNLDANSHYTYTFTVNGADNEVIETYSGTFDTSEETALSETEQANKPSRKIIRDGQVLILRNGVAYDMMGNML